MKVTGPGTWDPARVLPLGAQSEEQSICYVSALYAKNIIAYKPV